MSEREQLLLPRLVEEIMTRDVITISSEKSAEEAAKLMVEKGVGSLVVVEGEKIVGIITERDFLVRVISQGLNPEEVKVADFMTKSVITCSPDTRILDVVKLMGRHKIRRLPVVKEGRLVGIVTAYDVAIYGWGMPSH